MGGRDGMGCPSRWCGGCVVCSGTRIIDEFHVWHHLPLTDPVVMEAMRGWPPADIAAARDDALLYGNVYVVDGRYVPAAAFHGVDVDDQAAST